MFKKLRGQGVGWIVHMKPKVTKNENNPGWKGRQWIPCQNHQWPEGCELKIDPWWRQRGIRGGRRRDVNKKVKEKCSGAVPGWELSLAGCKFLNRILKSNSEAGSAHTVCGSVGLWQLPLDWMGKHDHFGVKGIISDSVKNRNLLKTAGTPLFWSQLEGGKDRG